MKVWLLLNFKHNIFWNILIKKPLTILGNRKAIINGNKEGYIFVINADNVTIKGITLQNVGKSFTKDFAAIYVSRSKNFLLESLRLENVFFGILIEKSHFGVVKNNHISSEAINEASSGNGIHMWHSSNMLVENNDVHNLRDGIYFEFVKHSKVINNRSYKNLRYGLHFMFSNNDEYHNNTFKNNGSGVAVMFSKFIKMTENKFIENWGTASYGLLLKEIYDAEIINNIFKENTTAINIEGSTRINYTNNDFIRNGWAITLSGGCLDNTITKMGGVYVGRITVSGYRFFYFYVSESEEKVKEVIDPIADVSDYKIRYDYELDASKNYYWNELYPTDDDWQVIQDLKVLDSLIDEGDVKDRSREVNHWAYFDIQQQANQYVQWVTEQAYKVVSNSKTEDDSEYLVQFSHTGTMHLGDITSHTIRANRKAKELGGRYDGWETSVERE